MKRSVLVVLLLTFVALVAATLWVPCNTNPWLPDSAIWGAAPELEWHWIGETTVLYSPHRGETGPLEILINVLPGYLPHAPSWIIQYGVFLVSGGLVALALHTRGRRQTASGEA